MSQAALSASPVQGVRRPVNRVPVSTYRLQLRSDFRLDQVRELLPYLRDLGISDVYLSPLFRARQESSHGYDVVDHGVIDRAFGDLPAFQKLAETAREAGMGILLDVVPNHMGINDPGNKWWLDVLENGEASQFADYFDIEWRPRSSHLQHKVLLPFLGEPLGSVLEKGDLKVLYDDGRLKVTYGPRKFPLAPSSWPLVLERARRLLGEEEGDVGEHDPLDVDELESVTAQLAHLPPPARRDEATTRDRYREQRVARRRLGALLAKSPAVRGAMGAAIDEINGKPGDARSFDQLEALLDRQSYRLAYWRVAADEINYRRFFDINDLAAIRVEDSRVFDAVHRLVARFLDEGWVTGLRIDHPDGLFDPEAYFERLQTLFKHARGHNGSGDVADIFIVAEKILSDDEPLPASWRVSGTTGYELLSLLNRFFVDGDGLAALRARYGQLTDQSQPPAEVLYDSKRTILLNAMASELQLLATQLHRCAQQNRASRDFTLRAIERALGEVIACLSVYRTYVRPQSWDVGEADYRRITAAVRLAKRRNPTQAASIFDFIASVLLLEHPPTVSREQAAERRQFALRMQQVTGPVTAKGIEDTAFYRYYPLASLNEVGGSIDSSAISPDEFHRLMKRRACEWPAGLSATATHDTKRGEDLRARLHVLSETHDAWVEAVQRWRELNRFTASADGDATSLDRNAEYLLYQTLVGTWPVGPMNSDQRRQYAERIVEYMLKAAREAKVHTAWGNRSAEYEQVVSDFVRRLLESDSAAAFRSELDQFVGQIATAGFVNALSQALLKITLPGVPDFYQGSELWDFNLVDPDNRRPVDFERRRQLLGDLKKRFRENPARLVARLAERWPDPSVKLFVCWRALAVRAAHASAGVAGDYLPVEVSGSHVDHLFAFARRVEDRWILVVTPRHVERLSQRAPNDNAPAVLKVDWRDTALILPADAPAVWRNELTGEMLDARLHAGNGPNLSAAKLLAALPVAILTSQS